MAGRPKLTDSLSESDFTRWYWTMAELQPFARGLGLRSAGPKAELSARIAAHLGGRPQPATPERAPKSTQLTGPLTRSTPIPKGQRASNLLRTFFEAEVGPTFTFNGHMRAFLRAGGATLGDAVDHWHRTLGAPLPTQSSSLEFNRFTREWHAAHPDGTPAECRKAWARHRERPADQRETGG